MRAHTQQTWKKFFETKYGDKTNYCSNCYQVMGVDLIVDDKSHARVIEVNGQPSMKLEGDANDHYTSTKKSMISDMIGMIYNDKDNSDELFEDLLSIDPSAVPLLKQRDIEYLLDFRRENALRGGFGNVYPSVEHFSLHSQFFSIQSVPNPHRLLMHNILYKLMLRIEKKRQARLAAAKLAGRGPSAIGEGVADEGDDADAAPLSSGKSGSGKGTSSSSKKVGGAKAGKVAKKL